MPRAKNPGPELARKERRQGTNLAKHLSGTSANRRSIAAKKAWEERKAREQEAGVTIVEGSPVNPYAGFLSVLADARTLHMTKSHDYGSTDPYANLSADFSIEPWVGCLLRTNDKMHRIQSFLLKGELKHESVEDSLLDMIVYLACALSFLRESR